LARDFLFEIGVEEIPAGFLAGAMDKLRDYFTTLLNDSALSFGAIHPYSTPRRLAVHITNVQERQEDRVLEKTGPAQNVAYNTAGALTKAGEGFLRSAGATPTDAFLADTPRGKCIAVRLNMTGRPTADILCEKLPGVIDALPFPKSMRWRTRELAFARPIRWIVALWGADVLDVTVAGLPAGRISQGNRYVALEHPVNIAVPADYPLALEAANVLAHRAERRQRIADQLNALFTGTDLRVQPDEHLLDTVTDLVEWPTAVAAEFEEDYLALPDRVIVLTLSEHQKYFAVRRGEHITRHFAFIGNGNPACGDIIRLGNEKVVRARLADARFYWNEDRKQPLEAFVPRLAEVTFQAKLGSVLEKTNRIQSLVGRLADRLHMNEETRAHAIRAALLCKADLVTHMLGEKEFTKLQGYMGMMYARACGEPEPVAAAMYEHYWNGDEPQAPGVPSALVAVADKLDTVCGIIGAGMIPTGSKDPYALRRAANGALRIIARLELSFDLFALVDEAFALLADKLDDAPKSRGIVREFLTQRIEWLLRESGMDYDVTASVMHVDLSNVPDLLRRARALQGFRAREDFIGLVLGFKRVSNIITGETVTGTANPALFVEPAEAALHKGAATLEQQIAKHLERHDYHAVLEDLTSFRSTIDRFFDDVLVNSEDDALRANRHRLLARIRALFLRVADLARLVVEGE